MTLKSTILGVGRENDSEQACGLRIGPAVDESRLWLLLVIRRVTLTSLNLNFSLCKMGTVIIIPAYLYLWWAE